MADDKGELSRALDVIVAAAQTQARKKLKPRESLAEIAAGLRAGNSAGPAAQPGSSDGGAPKVAAKFSPAQKTT